MERKELELALSEYKGEIEALVENVKSAQGEEKKALETKLAEAETQRKAMQEQLDAIVTEQKLAKQNVSEKVKTFAEELREKFTKEAEKISGLARGEVKALQFEMKAFLSTANASITTGSLLPQYQYEAGISKAPDRTPFMLDLVSTGIANSLTVFWTQRKTRTDNSEYVGEGVAPAAESVLGYETKTAVMQNLAAFIKVSNNSVDDIDWLLSEVQGELMTLLMLKIDAAILLGTVATTGFDGVYTKAAAFNAGGSTVGAGLTPTRYDVLKFAITQVKLANFKPNYIVLNPADVRDMELERDGNKQYLLPPFMQSIPGVGGIRIVENNGMTVGSYLVGDFTKAKFWLRKAVDIKVWEQNESDAVAQLKTITAYLRGTLVVKDADVNAFVKDTFADSITEITPV